MEGSAMDILEAVDVLQALGFHMYRKILLRGTLVGVALVYMPYDVYGRLIFNGGITYLDFGCGKWLDVEVLEYNLPGLLLHFAAERDTTRRHRVSESESDQEAVFPQKLAETENASGRKLDSLWQGCEGHWKALYRGAVLEINNQLRVLSIDGGDIDPQNRLFGHTGMDEQAGIPLNAAFGIIDEAGGYEEIPVNTDTPEA